jgi:hypothetical protein
MIVKKRKKKWDRLNILGKFFFVVVARLIKKSNNNNKKLKKLFS